MVASYALDGRPLALLICDGTKPEEAASKQWRRPERPEVGGHRGSIPHGLALGRLPPARGKHHLLHLLPQSLDRLLHATHAVGERHLLTVTPGPRSVGLEVGTLNTLHGET